MLNTNPQALTVCFYFTSIFGVIMVVTFVLAMFRGTRELVKKMYRRLGRNTSSCVKEKSY
jgi:Trk-type K+ transport system membrane component